MAQQTRVSNWVHDTVQQSHAYSNPFVLSPTLRDRAFYDQPDDDDGYAPRHHDQWSSSSRPSRSRSRSYVDHAVYDRTAPSRHRSQSHSRSPLAPRDTYSHHHSYSQPHAGPAARRTSPPRNYPYAPAGPTHSPTRQAYVSQPPPGQIYQLSPNAPAPVPKDSLYRHPSYSRHPSKPPPQPYLLVRGGGPKAEYKHGVRLGSTHVPVSC
jgi:hypothetical protein